MYRVMPLAPLFSLAGLGLVWMVWQGPGYLGVFNDPWLYDAGIALTVASVICVVYRRPWFPIAYDLFCVGTFCIWYISWRVVYRLDAPVFIWYPMFFVLLIVILNACVVHKARYLDPIQLQLIRVINSSRLFQALPIAVGLGLSIVFNEYFLFYPMLVSLLLIRCAFEIALQEIANS